MTVASDVTNTLCGPAGAAATYGPQKGCDEWAVQELDRALLHWGRAVEQATGRSVAEQPGAGAAGGTTAALLGFSNAVIRPGVEVVADAVGLADLLAAADLVITGEGQADEQTLSGKAAMGVAALARGNGTPVILLCGGLGPGAAALDASGAFAVVQPIADRPMRLAARCATPSDCWPTPPSAWRAPSRLGCCWPSRAAERWRQGQAQAARSKPAEAGRRPAEARRPGRGGARAAG